MACGEHFIKTIIERKNNDMRNTDQNACNGNISIQSSQIKILF